MGTQDFLARSVAGVEKAGVGNVKFFAHFES